MEFKKMKESYSLFSSSCIIKNLVPSLQIFNARPIDKVVKNVVDVEDMDKKKGQKMTKNKPTNTENDENTPTAGTKLKRKSRDKSIKVEEAVINSKKVRDDDDEMVHIEKNENRIEKRDDEDDVKWSIFAFCFPVVFTFPVSLCKRTKKVPDIGTKKEDVGAVQRTSEQNGLLREKEDVGADASEERRVCVGRKKGLRRKRPEKTVCVAARSRGWRKLGQGRVEAGRRSPDLSPEIAMWRTKNGRERFSEKYYLSSSSSFISKKNKDSKKVSGYTFMELGLTLNLGYTTDVKTGKLGLKLHISANPTSQKLTLAANLEPKSHQVYTNVNAMEEAQIQCQCKINIPNVRKQQTEGQRYNSNFSVRNCPASMVREIGSTIDERDKGIQFSISFNGNNDQERERDTHTLTGICGAANPGGRTTEEAEKQRTGEEEDSSEAWVMRWCRLNGGGSTGAVVSVFFA
ncbi:hypothetical protein LXL04_022041 [Taraxacum kok-saghyz]